MDSALFVDAALLTARLLLAVVFVVAGLAKLADAAHSRQALIDFGLPARLARPISPVLPLAELAVALALVATTTAWWGAVGALTLLLLFGGGIALNLARGQRPDCRCFGLLRAAPIGGTTLVRNLVLAAVAGFVVWQGRIEAGPSVLGWIAGLAPAERLALTLGALALGLLVALAWLASQIVRQQGRLLLRIEALETRLEAVGAPAKPSHNGHAPAPHQGLPVGAPAPTFRLPGLHGEELTLAALRAADRPVLLVFSDPGCGPCTALLPDLGRWQRQHAAELTVALISRGSVEANRAKTAEHGVTPVLLQRDCEVAEAYQAYGTPSAVLVRPDGTIASPVAAGAEAIRALAAHALGAGQPQPSIPTIPVLNGHDHGNPPHDDHGHEPHHAHPAAPMIGQPAPELRLADLDGKPVDLADFQGSTTLVLFWNPGCGFCQQMLADLKAWEADPPPEAPNLLVVSTGDVEVNRAMGLRSPVLLDQGFTVGPAFGANGTPMAVLVDADGRIASELAAGGPAVLALARARDTRAAAAKG